MKRDLTHAFSSFQIIRYPKRYLGPLQPISYALKIGLPIMELQWPEFFNHGYISIAHIKFDAPSWKFLK